MDALALIIVFVAIIGLVALANRINIAYPIVLVLGGMAIGYVPRLPTIPIPPDLVLVVFLPPLLYWEAVTAPTSEFRAGAGWIFQLAFGLVLATTAAVAYVAHAIVPQMGWSAAFVLGAIVSSTDEVAFSAIADRIDVPRHVLATIEGESLINDATSLILYGAAIAAVVGASFSIAHAAGALALSIVEAIAIGIAAGAIAVVAWKGIKDSSLQGTISVVVPFIAYLPAYYIGASGVLATVTTGIFVSRFTPRVLQPVARERISGFWVTVVFLLNAFIFVEVGIRFHSIVSALGRYSVWQLVWYGLAISVTCVAVRAAWVFAQGLLPITNQPEHPSGMPDWSHVAILAWTGMRGGVSLAAALAIPLETSAGPFPNRDLTIFLTFCVLLVTLVGQGALLPLMIRVLGVKDDGADEAEERLAMAATARTALARIEELERAGDVSQQMFDALRLRFQAQLEEFAHDGNDGLARAKARLRKIERELIDLERRELIRLRSSGEIDNTVLRRVERLLDLETAGVEILDRTGQPDVET